MPTQIEVVGFGPVEFPDGMSQDDIAQVLRTKFPKPQRSPETERFFQARDRFKIPKPSDFDEPLIPAKPVANALVRAVDFLNQPVEHGSIINEPTVSQPENLRDRQAEGIIRGGAEIASQLTTPKNLALVAGGEIAALPQVAGRFAPLVRRAIPGVFGAQAAINLPEAYSHARAIHDDPNSTEDEKSQAWTELAGQGLLALGLSAVSLKGIALDSPALRRALTTREGRIISPAEIRDLHERVVVGEAKPEEIQSFRDIMEAVKDSGLTPAARREEVAEAGGVGEITTRFRVPGRVAGLSGRFLGIRPEREYTVRGVPAGETPVRPAGLITEESEVPNAVQIPREESPATTPTEASAGPIQQAAIASDNPHGDEASAGTGKAVDKPKSSTQLTLNPETAKPFLDFAQSIPDAEVYHKAGPTGKEDYGVETEPHITVLFGLTKHEPGSVAKAIAGHGPISVTLGKLSVFENEDYDVLKVEVEGKGLLDLNKKVSALPNEQNFKDYQPHLTIAYLKKGEGEKYVGDTRFEGQKITFDTMTFSPPEELRAAFGKPELTLTKGGEKANEGKGSKRKKGLQEVLTPSKAGPVKQAQVPSSEEVIGIIQILRDNNIKIRSKGAAGEGTKAYYETDDYTRALKGPGKIVFSKTGEAPDSVVDLLQRQGLANFDSPGELMAAIADDGESKGGKRARVSKEQRSVQAGEEQLNRFESAREENAADPFENPPVDVPMLKVGDKFKLDKEVLTVTSVNLGPDGEFLGVTVDDGRKFGTQNLAAATTIHPDSGEVVTTKKASVLGQFVPASELARFANDQSNGLSASARKMLSILANSPVLKGANFAGFVFSTEPTLPGQLRASVADKLVTFSTSADAETVAHELAHLAYEMLPEADRALIEKMRRSEVTPEMPQPIQDGTMTTREFIDSGLGDTHPDWYRLINPSEFYANLIGKGGKEYERETSNKEFAQRNQNWIQGLLARITEFFSELWKAIFETIRPPAATERLVSDFLKGKFKPTAETGQKLETQGSPLFEAEKVAREAGVARAAEPLVNEYRRAAKEIDRQNYGDANYRKAVKELRRLESIAQARALELGSTADQLGRIVPAIAAQNFIEALTQLGVPFDEGNIKELQDAVLLEDDGERLVKLRDQIRQTAMVRDYLQGLGLLEFNEVLADYDRTIAALNKRITRLSRKSYLFNDGAETVTVLQQANRIEAERSGKIDNLAKKQALEIDPVRQTFVEPMDALVAMRDQAAQISNDRPPAQVLADPTVYEADKLALANALFRQVEMFGVQRTLMDGLKAYRAPILDEKIAKLKTLRREARLREGYAEVMLTDLIEVMAGGKDRTGTLEAPADVNWVREHFGAIEEFARKMADLYGRSETNVKQLLEDFLTDPGLNDLGAFDPRSVFGVTPEVFSDLRRIASRSEPFRAALTTLVKYADKSIKELPRTQLGRLERLLDEGYNSEARTLYYRLAGRARATGVQNAALADRVERELTDLQVERKSLDYGSDLFAKSFDSPPMKELRAAAAAGSNYVQEMIVKNPNVTTFKGFKAGDLNQPKLDLTSKDYRDRHFAEKAFGKISDWANNAALYVAAYDGAMASFNSGASNLLPDQLGFDAATYRGLKLALENDVDLLLDPSNVFDATTINPLWASAFVQQMDFLGIKPNQIEQTAQLLGGLFGAEVMQALGDPQTGYRNQLLSISALTNYAKYQRLPDLRSAALLSHKKEMDLDIEAYRQNIFNQMAHLGRMVGSPLAGNGWVGYQLPSGFIVTQADMDFFRLARDYGLELLKISQRRADKATREKVGLRELSRPAGSVGDLGTPRHVNDNGNLVTEALVRVYGRDPSPTPITTGTDLSVVSDHPLVQLWTEMAQRFDFLTAHILDSERLDRAVKTDPLLLRAERLLATRIAGGNYVEHYGSLEDLVASLEAVFPQTTGVPVREYIIEALGKELESYATLARAREARYRDRTSTFGQLEIVTADSEFTRAANLLELPGKFYDYSALSDADLSMMRSRASAQSALELILALKHAEQDLGARIEEADPSQPNRTPNPKALPTGVSLRTAKLIHTATRKLVQFMTEKSALAGWEQAFLEKLTGTGVRSVLASPLVGMRNVTQGAMAPLFTQIGINQWGKLAAMAQTMAIVGKALTKVAVNLAGEGITAIPGAKQAILELKRSHPALYRASLQWAEDLYSYSVQDAINHLRLDLGFSPQIHAQRSIKQSIAQAYEVRDAAERRSRLVPDHVRALSAGLGAGFNLSLEAVGLERFDIGLNAAVLSQTIGKIETNLREGAARYMTGQHSSDPTDPTYLAKPEEFSSRMTSAGGRNNLANIRELLKRAGVQLEYASRRWWERSEGGAIDTPFFLPDEMASVERLMVADANASSGTNRAEAIKRNPTLRQFYLLQGYSLDFVGKLLNAFRGTRGDHSPGQRQTRLFNQFGILLFVLMAGFIFAGVSEAQREAFLRMLGRSTGRITPLDNEFYREEGLAERAFKYSMGTIPYVGGAALSIMQSIVGNKGFGPQNNWFPLSMLSAGFDLVTTLKTVPFQDWDWAFKKFFDRWVPPFALGRSVFGSDADKQYRSGVVALSEALNQAGVKHESKGFGGPAQVGPTSGIQRKLEGALLEAVQARRDGDAAGYQEKVGEARELMDRLVEMKSQQARKEGDSDQEARKKGEQAAAQVYRSMNPALRANSGAMPSQDELTKALSLLSGKRRELWDQSSEAYSLGADLLGRPEPAFAKQDRAVGGGGGPIAAQVTGGGAGPIRVRGGSVRVPGLRIRGARSGLRSLIRRPRLARARLPRVRKGFAGGIRIRRPRLARV